MEPTQRILLHRAPCRVRTDIKTKAWLFRQTTQTPGWTRRIRQTQKAGFFYLDAGWELKYSLSANMNTGPVSWSGWKYGSKDCLLKNTQQPNNVDKFKRESKMGVADLQSSNTAAQKEPLNLSGSDQMKEFPSPSQTDSHHSNIAPTSLRHHSLCG